MVLSRTTAWTALSLTLPLDHFFFFADLPPLEAAGLAEVLGGYRIKIVSFCRAVSGCHPKWGIAIHHDSHARDRQQDRQMQLAGRPDGLDGMMMRNTHHVVGGRRSSVKTGSTPCVVFTAVVPTVRELLWPE